MSIRERWNAFLEWVRTPLVKTHAIIAGVAFSVAWVLVAVFILPDTGAAPSAVVPPVVGLRYDEAERKLAEAGLRAALGETRPSATAPRRYVLAQTPAAGTAVGPEVVVTLDISAGQLRVTVPPVTGLSREDAVNALRTAELEIGQIVERPGPQARGTVLSTAPDAGQQVPQGTPVELVVSTGPTQLLMPDVVGRELFEVRATLEQLGLRIGETQYDSTSALPTGLVVSQLPAAGSPVTASDFISIRVSGRP
ncbi:MAG TPA: PASTA domain-containing protein [Gemmatimonadaceae bacterium]